MAVAVMQPPYLVKVHVTVNGRRQHSVEPSTELSDIAVQFGEEIEDQEENLGWQSL